MSPAAAADAAAGVVALGAFRRDARVLVCAGGPEYVAARWRAGSRPALACALSRARVELSVSEMKRRPLWLSLSLSRRYLRSLAIELGDDRGLEGGRTGAIARGALAAAVASVDLVVVPVLLLAPGAGARAGERARVGDARAAWRAVSPAGDGADAVVAFPVGADAWGAYLSDEARARARGARARAQAPPTTKC